MQERRMGCVSLGPKISCGRLVKFGKQPVDFKLQAFSHVVKPDAGPDWSVMAAVKFLFPK